MRGSCMAPVAEAAVALCYGAGADAAGRPPNIVFIISDDQGCHGRAPRQRGFC